MFSSRFMVVRKVPGNNGLMRWSTRLGVIVLAPILLTACATSGTPGNPGATPMEEPVTETAPPADVRGFVPPAADGEVMGQGTVLQTGQTRPRFCLGAVQESYPPQCSGPEIIGWDWGVAEQEVTEAGVTWGTYAATGTWDGTIFTLTTAPIPLSLYDSMPLEDPLAGREGATDPQELDRILNDVFSSAEGYLLTAWVEKGFVNVTVVYDDGSFQALMDAEYGPDVVVVISALRHVS